MATRSKVEAMLGAEEIRVCADPAMAEERAAALISDEGDVPAGAFWQETARLVLRGYLMAAGLANADAATLARWVGDPSDEAPARVLREHAERVSDGWLNGFQLYTDTGSTGMTVDVRDSVRFTMLAAVTAEH